MRVEPPQGGDMTARRKSGFAICRYRAAENCIPQSPRREVGPLRTSWPVQPKSRSITPVTQSGFANFSSRHGHAAKGHNPCNMRVWSAGYAAHIMNPQRCT